MDTIQTTNDPKTYLGMEPRPRIAVEVVTHNTERDSLRGLRRYHGLMIHTKKSSEAARNSQPLIGMVIAEPPQVLCGEGYMILLTYSKEVAMIVVDSETGCQIMDICMAVDAATEIGDTIDEEHDTGDMI